ncbi:MAG: aldehyde dehydrogenase family protein [Candidatus Thorarchaeota archaeon]
MFTDNSIFEPIYELGTDGKPILKNYLAGNWVKGSTQDDLHSPIDGSLFVHVSKLSSEQMNQTVNEVFEKGRSSIRNFPGKERMKTFLKAATLLRENKEDFIDVLVRGGGKPYGNAEGEVIATIERLEKTAMEFGFVIGDYIPGDWNEETMDSEAIVKREPYGILFAISSFNYPLFISMTKTIPALLLGNATILKPASAVPVSAIMMTRLLEIAGLPKESLATILISGKETTKYLSDIRVQAISFTGSTEVGQTILRNAGIKQFHLELGGKDPAIVLNDADVNKTVEKLIKGLLSNSGQRCDAIRLIIVEKEIYSEVKAALKNKYLSIKPENPLTNKKTIMGPLIDTNAAESIENAYNDAISKGARPLVEFKRNKNYVWPMILETDPESITNLDAYKNDVFGPLSLLVKVDSEEEAVKIANGTPFGLDACVFGTDSVRMRKLSRNLEVGAVFLNEHPRHGIGYYPFGGMKDSGIGREGIGYSIDQLTTTKTIITNFKGRGVWKFDY